MRWARLALVAGLAAAALWWASPPARACSCDRRPFPNVVFEGIAVSHASAPQGWEYWTFALGAFLALLALARATRRTR